MVTFTKAQLVLRFPEFAGEADARVAAMLEMARDFVSEDVLGSQAKTGLMLYTSHLLASTTAAKAGTSGPLTSSRVGDLARGYAAPAPGANSLSNTSYGQLYLKLIQALAAGGEFVQALFPADPSDI